MESIVTCWFVGWNTIDLFVKPRKGNDDGEWKIDSNVCVYEDKNEKK